LVDHGVLRLSEDSHAAGLARAKAAGYALDPQGAPTVPYFNVDDEAIVEWRALTVALLDQVADGVRKALGQTATQMPLAVILEAGTWKVSWRDCAGMVESMCRIETHSMVLRLCTGRIRLNCLDHDNGNECALGGSSHCSRKAPKHAWTSNCYCL
jgi:hypothetical protein